jgi:Neuraminidase (sialidase)
VRAPVFSPRGPVLAPDGKLYYVGLSHKLGKAFTVIHSSSDGGKTWQFHSDVAYSPAVSQASVAEAFDEPNLGILTRDRWLTTIRVDLDGYVRQSASTDGGRTWTWPQKLAIRGYPQHLCPLKDGRLMMTYGFRFPPLGIRGCVSSDGGKTWDTSREIVFRHDGKHGDLGYPYSIELDGGRVFTVYYYNGPDGDCYIEGAFYKP